MPCSLASMMRLTWRTSPRKHCRTRRNSYRESESAPMPSSKSDDYASPRELVPDPVMRREFGV